MTVLPDKHYSGHSKATEEEDDQRTPDKEISIKEIRQQDLRRWKYRKIGAAARDRAVRKQEVCCLCSTVGIDKTSVKSSPNSLQSLL